MLQRNKLGNTGLEVSRLGLGGLFISNGVAERKQSCEVIRRAWELGINYIDTAPSYYDSEEVIGEALSSFDADFIVSTKMGDLPAKDYRPQDKEFLRERLERSFRRLRRNHVNMVMIHEPDNPERFYDWWADKETYQGPVLDLLREYRDAGRLDHIGLGGMSTTEMTRLINSGKFEVVLTAFNYSLLFQEAATCVLPAAKRHGMGVIAGSPLQQGAFAKIYDEGLVHHPARWLSVLRRRQFLKLYELVNDCKIPLPELALRFVLSNPDIQMVLTGARSVEELELNVAAAERGPLPQEILDAVGDIYAMCPQRPYLEPLGLYFKPDYNRNDAEE